MKIARESARTLAAALALVLLAAVGVRAARAQNDVAATPAPATPPVRTLAMASWTSDRMPLRPGDLLTVVVSEKTQSQEQVSQVSKADRSQKGTLDATANGTTAVGETHVATGLTGQSNDTGEAKRLGNLTATLTVKVVAITPEGLAQIEGSKKVTVDGRPQTVTLKGLVRPQDVTGGNRVDSSRIADAEILYTGKKMGPRNGFIGKLIGAIWP
ncbi:MAG TPA: flagellar basal body L-ring protein FlgH [Candidatus Sulfotelmatobacter sp.]|nr:flagellar basal body L-ring protein FlgH [Candidatus Sulfotelmatobacter sp.]